MGLRELFGLRGARDKPTNSYNSGVSFLFGRSTSGISVNERTAMQTTAVYSCVRILAEAIASLPLHLYRYTDKGKERVFDHPLYHILHDEPNEEMTSFVFREVLMSHLLIWGNAYAQIIRDGRGQVLGLYPLLPDKMEVDRAENGELYYIYTRNTEENPNFKDYGRIYLRREDVLHIPGLGFDGLVGYSPIAMAKNAVGMTLACEEYGASFFLETRKFQINEIARMYRIPPHMVGDLEKSSFSNIEQQSLEFVKYTLDPWVVRWEQALQKALLLPQEKNDYFIKLNVDGLLRGDYASRMNGYAVGRQNGWLSANDIREMEDQNPIPEEDGGNLYLVNGSMTKLADAGAFAGKAGGNMPQV